MNEITPQGGRRGRRRRYAAYDELVASLPREMAKRPHYVDGIGVFRGARGDTAWLKVRFPHGGTYRGRSYAPEAAVEIKLGSLSSWTWAQLEAKRDELQGKAERGEALEAERVPLFSVYASEWLERLTKRQKGQQERVIVHAHLIPRFGKKSLEAISTKDVNKFISDRLGKAKPATVKREVTVINSIMNDAVRLRHIEENPAKRADRISNIVPRSRYLDSQEIHTLAEKAEEEADWLTDFIKWLLVSGMRRGEALSLKWSDIRRLPNGSFIVHIEKSKSGKPRDIPCNAIMADVLERQAKRKKDGDARVFPVSLATLKRRWSSAKAKAKLTDDQNVTLHDLRRTYATQAIVAGVDPRTLMGLLGHSSMRMLESVYAVAMESATKEASAKIEQTFKSLASPNGPQEAQGAP